MYLADEAEILNIEPAVGLVEAEVGVDSIDENLVELVLNELLGVGLGKGGIVLIGALVLTGHE